MRYDAIFFDVDGTLIDSNDAHADAWSRAATLYGFARPPEFFRPMIGMGGDRVLPSIDASLDESTDLGRAVSKERKRLMLQEYIPGLKPTPGARAFVEACRSHGLQCVIATSSTAEELEAALTVAGVASLIDVRVCYDDIRKAKPAPDVVSVALSKANVAADRAVLIGDTRYNVESAAKADVDCIGVRSGGSSMSDLTGAVAIFDDPAAAMRGVDALLADR